MRSMVEADPERGIESVVRRVCAALGFGVEHEDVEQRVREAFAAREGVPIRDFLPILVEREVVSGLRRRPGPAAAH